DPPVPAHPAAPALVPARLPDRGARTPVIQAATLHALAIPFRERFRHSSSERAVCDSVLVRVIDRDGCEGWGEGAPRPHVTGETVDSMLADLEAAWPE